MALNVATIEKHFGKWGLLQNEVNRMNKDSDKSLTPAAKKAEIKLKTNPKAEAIRKAPDEVVAMAIRDAILKDKTGGK